MTVVTIVPVAAISLLSIVAQVVPLAVPLPANSQARSPAAIPTPQSPPQGRVTIACVYPKGNADADGVTVLSVRIMSDGLVRYPQVVKSSGNSDLDDAAVRCLAVARLRPVTQDGKPAEVTWQRQVVWDPHGRSRISVPKTGGQSACTGPLFRTQGKVVTAVSFHIAPDGTTRDIKVKESSGNSGLDEVATKCVVPHWRYPPASQAGKPIEIDWGASVEWKLR